MSFSKALLLARGSVIVIALVLLVAACAGSQSVQEPIEVTRMVEVTRIVEGTSVVESVVVTATPGPESEQPTGSKEEVIFYSGLQREVTDALVADFESKNSDIEVVVFQAPIESLLQKVELEVQSTGTILGDVLWTGDILIMNDFKSRDLLEAYVPPGADQIPDHLKDPDGYWHTTVPLSLYIMYNSNNVTEEEAPSTWEELADPAWHNRIALSDPAVSGTAAILTAALADEYGWEYWEAVAEGNPLINPSTVSLLNLVVSGERDIAPMVDFLVWQSLERGDPVNVVSPEDGLPGTHIIAALVKGARHAEAGKRLIDYLASLDAAEIQASMGFYHARMDAPAPNGMPAMDQIEFMDFDWDAYAETKEAVKENFRETMQ